MLWHNYNLSHDNSNSIVIIEEKIVRYSEVLMRLVDVGNRL